MANKSPPLYVSQGSHSAGKSPQLESCASYVYTHFTHAGSLHKIEFTAILPSILWEVRERYSCGSLPVNCKM